MMVTGDAFTIKYLDDSLSRTFGLPRHHPSPTPARLLGSVRTRIHPPPQTPRLP
jgi:hypothetical protein